MKKLFSVLIITILLFSCNGEKTFKRRLSESAGTLNNLTIVCSNKMWEGEVGDATRSVFAAQVVGLPLDEPIFDLKQMLPNTFHGYVKKSRTFIQIEKGKQKGVSYVKDIYATPQLGITISGKDNAEIIALLKEKGQEMVQKIKDVELAYKLSGINENPYEGKEIKETFGVDVPILFNYRIRKKTDNFIWMTKEIKNGHMNLLLYELPFNTLKDDSLSVRNFVKIRDSIGKAHVPGPSQGSYLITETAFSPYKLITKIDNKKTIEARGGWEVANDFMGGPFIGYIINDKKNNRQLVIEGFTYAPQISKRNYMFELETSIRSLTFN